MTIELKEFDEVLVKGTIVDLVEDRAIVEFCLENRTSTALVDAYTNELNVNSNEHGLMEAFEILCKLIDNYQLGPEYYRDKPLEPYVFTNALLIEISNRRNKSIEEIMTEVRSRVILPYQNPPDINPQPYLIKNNSPHHLTIQLSHLATSMPRGHSFVIPFGYKGFIWIN